MPIFHHQPAEASAQPAGPEQTNEYTPEVVVGGSQASGSAQTLGGQLDRREFLADHFKPATSLTISKHFSHSFDGILDSQKLRNGWFKQHSCSMPYFSRA